MVLVIQDEQLARQLQQIAEHERRSVEDVLKTMVAQYPSDKPAEKSEAVKRVRRKAYAKARRYWESVGDVEKAAMTDEALDEQFWLFDSEGIPRLTSEQGTIELVPGSGAWVAANIETLAFHTENPIDAKDADDILDAEFADYLLKRMDNGTPTDTGG